eukprot:3392932-Alexandrium_andersonii.AAC.1
MPEPVHDTAMHNPRCRDFKKKGGANVGTCSRTSQTLPSCWRNPVKDPRLGAYGKQSHDKGTPANGTNVPKLG